MNTPTENYAAMLVDLRISCWTARKQDKKVSKEAAATHGVASHLGAYYKTLIDSPELKEVSRVTGAARDTHYKFTLPWLDSGQRVLPSAVFFDYSSAMQLYRDEYDRAVQAFLNVYPQRRIDARQMLGTMFNDADYPSLHQVADKFAFRMHISPVPAGNDFRCDLGEAQVEAIRKDITETTNATMAGAVSSLYARIADVLGAFTERLDSKDKVFRDSLVQNARGLVDLLPKLNVTNDPKIAELCNSIKVALCTFEPDQLRQNETLRTAVHTRATSIKNTLNDFLTGAL